jgi:hypothetical protein
MEQDGWQSRDDDDRETDGSHVASIGRGPALLLESLRQVTRDEACVIGVSRGTQ